MAKGDHLYYICALYIHHGIDCGDGTIIEYSRYEGVRQIPESEFGQGKTIYIQDHCPPYSPDEIVERAKSRLGEQAYHPLTNNCEHLANWSIEGESSSAQVKRGVKVVKSIGAIGASYVVGQLIDNILPDDADASEAENEARAAARSLGKTAGLTAGVTTAVVDGEPANIMIAPVTVGLVATGLAYLFRKKD